MVCTMRKLNTDGNVCTMRKPDAINAINAINAADALTEIKVKIEIKEANKMNKMDIKKESPSMDEWLKEAKLDASASKIGMYLVHNGIVRKSAKAKVRQNAENTKPVTGLDFSYDQGKVDAATSEAYKMDGIYYLRVWLNEGRLSVGDDIMYVLVGGDIRPHVIDALQALVGKIKSECVIEKEIYD